MERCGAKLRGKDQHCRKWPLKGRTRCELHGGGSLKGLAHPSLKHGRYSIDVPARFSEQLERALTDTDTLNLTDEIGLKTVRIGELLKRVDSGESGALWRDLKVAWSAFRDAQRARDTVAMVQLTGEIDTLITRGYSDSAIWREIGIEIDQRRKLVDTERRRRIDMQTMMTAERVGVMYHALTEAILKNVHDDATLNAILTEFGDIIDHPDSRSSPAQPGTISSVA